MVELIVSKRDGLELSADAIRWIIREYTADRIPDYQMSALLMAILLNGLTDEELAPWTEAMLHSGETLDLSDVSKPKIDKHSTGGVGDKISIPLAPIVAACGVAVPMISGRALGHTGGTLDKLESIPGFSVMVDPEEFKDQLDTVGVVMAGQTETLVPADRRMYGLRDATGTVPSIPLIASSVMSKKLAEDLDGLVLDVKVGSGAFMRSLEDATTLAETMVEIGRAAGTPTVAILTRMDQPLGAMVGNANEIAESIDVLKGGGPDDVAQLVETLAVAMLKRVGQSTDEATHSVRKAVASGAALDVFAELVKVQGGDPGIIDNPNLLPHAPREYVLKARRDGWVTRCDARVIGNAAVRLRAGRATKEDAIDPSVGFEILAKVGQRVTEGHPLARVAFESETVLERALQGLSGAWTISDDEPEPTDVILGVVE